MNIREYEKLSEEKQLAIQAHIVAKAVPLFMDGLSVTLIHRRTQLATGYSRNLVENVLRTHKDFKVLVKDRWNEKIKVRKFQNLENSCQA
jgi:hypothetical protein